MNSESSGITGIIHTRSFCTQTNSWIVICGFCGNNHELSDNGTDGKPCPECDSARKSQVRSLPLHKDMQNRYRFCYESVLVALSIAMKNKNEELADHYRDLAEEFWYKLTDDEQSDIDNLSEDLYIIDFKEYTSIYKRYERSSVEFTDELDKDFKDLVSSGAIREAMELLRTFWVDSSNGTEPNERGWKGMSIKYRAELLAMCWEKLGFKIAADCFRKEVEET